MFSCPIQIRMSDLDPYNHVNNGAQCNYFDMGRSRFFEHVFQTKIDWLTFKYVLVHVGLDFKMPIRFHDDLVCESVITEVGNSSFKMIQRLVDQTTGMVKTECHAVVVYFDREANQSERIPDMEREKLEEWKVRGDLFRGNAPQGQNRIAQGNALGGQFGEVPF